MQAFGLAKHGGVFIMYPPPKKYSRPVDKKEVEVESWLFSIWRRRFVADGMEFDGDADANDDIAVVIQSSRRRDRASLSRTVHHQTRVRNGGNFKRRAQKLGGQTTGHSVRQVVDSQLHPMNSAAADSVIHFFFACLFWIDEG